MRFPKESIVVVSANDVIPLLHLVGSRIQQEKLAEVARKEEGEKAYIEACRHYAEQKWLFRLMFDPPSKPFFMAHWLFSNIPRLQEIQKLLSSSGWSEIHLSESDWRLLKDLNQAQGKPAHIFTE